MKGFMLFGLPVLAVGAALGGLPEDNVQGLWSYESVTTAGPKRPSRDSFSSTTVSSFTRRCVMASRWKISWRMRMWVPTS